MSKDTKIITIDSNNIDLEKIEEDDIELLQDMIVVAINDAINQINKETEEKINNL